jgi:hypothetical protein
MSLCGWAGVGDLAPGRKRIVFPGKGKPPTYTPERVVAIRTTIAKTSQAVFASPLNVSVSTSKKKMACQLSLASH